MEVNGRNPKHFFEALPSEITIDILSRLPSKPLHRSKCVCKAWYSFINTPTFIQYFNNHSSTHNNRMLIFNSSDSLTSVELEQPAFDNDTCAIHPFTKHGVDDACFVGTCNGLVCFTNASSCWEETCFIYNPFTHYLSTIPAPVHDLGCFGFGYDDLNNTYKIMATYRSHNPSCITTKLFSLSSNSWRTLESFPYLISYGNCVFLNGALHWFVSSGPGVPSGTTALMAFDLRYETFSLVPLPNEYYGWRQFDFEFEVLEGNLSFHVKNFGNPMKPCMDLWVMKEYGVKESWTKLFRIPYMSWYTKGLSFKMKALAYSKSRGRVLLQQDYKFFWCDVEGEMMNNVHSVFPRGFKSRRKIALVCLRSLVCPAIGKEQPGNKIGS